MTKRIAILCRGGSVGEFRNYSHLFDKVYIAGRFRREMRKVGKKHFRNKEVVHAAARRELSFLKEQYEMFGKTYCQIPFHSFSQYRLRIC